MTPLADVSRRSLFGWLAAAAVAAALPPPLLGEIPGLGAVPAPAGARSGVALVLGVTGQSEPAFARRLAASFPGVAGSTLAPYSALLITNKTDRPIRGFTVRWSSGNNAFLVHRFARSGRNNLATAARPVLRPGETRLVAPYVALAPRSPRARRPLPSRSVAAHWLEAERFGTGFDVTVDDVLFADGTLVGSGGSSLERQLGAAWDAERDLARALLDEPRGTRMSGRARSAIEALASGPPSPARAFARQFLARAPHWSVADLTTRLERLAVRPPLIRVRVPAAPLELTAMPPRLNHA